MDAGYFSVKSKNFNKHHIQHFFSSSSVILGTTSGQLVIMDHHGNTTEICSVTTQSIRQLAYSCNKFYPEAPANSKEMIYSNFIHDEIYNFLDATKFVNDDYILACSLENGEVLFLNNHHDQSPIIIDTDLQSKFV